MALSVITISCEHYDVPWWEMKSSQEMGRTVESPPQRKRVKYSNMIILVACGCVVTDGSDLDPDWYFPSDKC